MRETANAARVILDLIDTRKPQVVELAKYLSLAARIEPVLLRKTRLTFLPKSEPGLEADLWFSPLVQSRGSDAIMLRTDIVALLREDLAAQEESGGQLGRPLDRAWELLRTVHRMVPVALQLEEKITYLALSGEPDAKSKIEEQLQKVAATMAQAARIGDLARWASRALPRLPQLTRQTSTVSVLALAAGVRLGNYRILDVPFPDENALSWLPELLPKDLARVHIGVRLFDQSVEFGDPDLEGSHILDVPKTNPVLLEVSWDELQSTYIQWEPGQIQRITVKTSLIIIRTLLGETYRLRSLSIPIQSSSFALPSVENGQIAAIQENVNAPTSVDFPSSPLQHGDGENILDHTVSSELSNNNSKIEVLICYAHKDELLMRALERQLRVLEQQNLITIWHDRMILGGFDSKQEMRSHINSARIILFLVSSDFIASENNTSEIQQAMERHVTGEARVIPVILRPALWRGSVFGKLNPLPTDGKPVTGSTWHNHDEAFIDIAEGVQQAVEELNRPAAIAISTLNSSEQPQPVKKQQKSLSPEFDVFLCHNSVDKPEVKKIAEELKRRGIKPWLDEWELRPGFPWQRALEAQIDSIKSAAVFVGKGGIGPWQYMELDAFLGEFVRRGCPVIPVILANAPDKPKSVPMFLRNMTWVDFRKQEPDPTKQLIWGITSKRPDADGSNDSSPISFIAHPSTSKGSTLSFTKKAELVNILLDCTCIRNRDSRETVLGLLNEQFSGIANAVSRGTDDQTDVMEIVSICLEYAGSLQGLVDIVTYFEDETSINTQQLRNFMQNNAL